MLRHHTSPPNDRMVFVVFCLCAYTFFFFLGWGLEEKRNNPGRRGEDNLLPRFVFDVLPCFIGWRNGKPETNYQGRVFLSHGCWREYYNKYINGT